jgi:hypothetical protein
MSIKTITRYFNIIDRSLFTVCGSLDYERITDSLIKLANTIADYDGDTESIWYIGEYGACSLADLIVGAYWHYTEWHAGQWSKGYAALCALGRVFDPGMTMPETGNWAYIALNELAAQ